MSLELIRKQFEEARKLLDSKDSEESGSVRIRDLLRSAIALTLSRIAAIRNAHRAAIKNRQPAYGNANELSRLRELLPKLYYYLGYYYDKCAEQLSDQDPKKGKRIESAVRNMKLSIAANKNIKDDPTSNSLYGYAHFILAKHEQDLSCFVKYYAQCLACENVDLSFAKKISLYAKYLQYKDQYENMVPENSGEDLLDEVSITAQEELDRCHVTFVLTADAVPSKNLEPDSKREVGSTEILHSPFFYKKVTIPKVTPDAKKAVNAVAQLAMSGDAAHVSSVAGYLRDDNSATAAAFYSAQPAVANADASFQTAAAPMRLINS